jgi:hypothetical protein
MAGRPHDAQRPQTRRRLAESPWARVDRVQLIRREVREVLAPSALELLFAHAERVVEGGDEVGGSPAHAGRRVYATIMVTIDLRRCARYFREPPDSATAERVAELMEASPDLERKLVRLVRGELAALAHANPDALDVTLETTVRTDGPIVYVDADAMATLVAPPRARGGEAR